ncbi:hypothetical protein ACJJIQ_00095 (plasmid) [Microbulbifer sp. ANSA003]|uniref:hypothetical protein n=1 Tax=Microbulbifer sp. ANSA003 TaxID=3243360 RepID=UPI0040436A3B
MSKKTLFQRVLDKVQHLVSKATGCSYRWQIRVVYHKDGNDLFFREATISLTRRSGIFKGREIVKCFDLQSYIKQQVERHPGWGNGVVRVVPVAYLGWF